MSDRLLAASAVAILLICGFMIATIGVCQELRSNINSLQTEVTQLQDKVREAGIIAIEANERAKRVEKDHNYQKVYEGIPLPEVKQ